MRTLVAEILAAWRRAERLTEELPPGSPQHAAATLACDRLRDLYQQLTPVIDGGVAEEDARTLLAELDARRAD